MINIRNYKSSDTDELWSLFYNTVRKVNICDYSQAQVAAWAPDDLSAEYWQQKMEAISPFIAEINGEIVGYADLQQNGLIDHFFCHKRYQRQGIGRCLMQHLFKVGKAQGISTFTSNVSITARPFYEQFGFRVIKAQIVEIRNQKLSNFIMSVDNLT